MSKRQRDKARNQTSQLLGVPVATVVPARSGIHPLGSVGIALAAAAAMALATAMMFGTVMFPGVILVILAVHAMSPQRLVAVCDQGFALVDRSSFNNKPKKVIGLFGFDQLVAGERTVDHARFDLGPEELWVHKNEVANLAPAAGPSVPGFIGG